MTDTNTTTTTTDPTAAPIAEFIARNFHMRSAPSPLGDLREVIHRNGYGCSLESAKKCSFWPRIEGLHENFVKTTGDMEVNTLQTALKELSTNEVEEWKSALADSTEGACLSGPTGCTNCV